MEYFIDTCTSPTITIVFPLNTCVPMELILYSRPNQSTRPSRTYCLPSIWILAAPNLSKARLPQALPAQVFLRCLSRVFILLSNDINCFAPTEIQGFVNGVCYQNIQQEASFQFQSCGSDATYTLSTPTALAPQNLR